MSKTHIATFILHSTSNFFLFHYVTNSTVLCCKSVTLNNNKKSGWGVGGGGEGWGGGVEGWGEGRGEKLYNPTKNPIKLEAMFSKCIHILQKKKKKEKNNLKQIRLAAPARRK